MAVNIVTGRRGEAHITSDDDRARNVEAMGGEKFVLNVGNRLWATKVNDNTVQIQSGMCMSHGTQMGIERNVTETVYIDNGVSGYMRNDLICMRYTRDTTTDTEQATLVVIKGNPVIGTPTDPDSWVDGDPMHGATQDDVPLWRVCLNGTSIEKLEPVYKLRNGRLPTDPAIDPSGTGGELDPTNTSVITAERIDILWGSALQDGDAWQY